jgi:hypothetical protein
MPVITELSILNDALANTANGLIDQAGLDALDPSTPVTADNDALYLEDRAHRAYARELPLLLERHPWNFAKATEALEQVDEDDNPSNRFGFAYEFPFFCLWLQKVEAPGGSAVDYEIIGRFICTDYDGTDDNAPIATFIAVPQPSDTSNLFWEILRQKVEVGILRTINEDYNEATRRDNSVEQMLLPMVRTRTDQQQPTRKAFRSTIRERRRSGGGPSAI